MFLGSETHYIALLGTDPALPLKLALYEVLCPSIVHAECLSGVGFSLLFPQISVSVSLFHAQCHIFLFCPCMFWGSNLLRPAVSSIHVLDANPLWSIHFKVCWPWCSFALHLQVTESFPLNMHVQDIHTHIYICIHTDTPVQAMVCQSIIHLNVQASQQVSPQI